MINNTSLLSNFVNLSYNYIVDDITNEIKYVDITSNTVDIKVSNSNKDIIPSNASIQYSYIVDPNNMAKTTLINTDQVETLFSYASLKTSKKFSDMQYADVDDTINYVITVANNGNLVANNVLFKDPMPEGVKFIPGSIVIDGVLLNDLIINPSIGFNIGMIPPNTFKVVTFKVKVINIPKSNEILNIAQFSYNFSLNDNDTSSKVFGDDTTGEGVITKISHADLGSIKTQVDKTFAFFGDILTYTTTIPNTGNVNATNVVFSECIPIETKLIEGSIEATIDDITILSGLGNDNDNSINLNIGTIPSGKIAIVIFKVKVVN